MKRIFLLMLVFVSLGVSAQTTPSYKNVKLTQLPLGTKNDSIVLTNGSTKLLKYMPISQVLSSKENVSNKDNGELTTSTQTYPTSAVVKGELDNIKSQINPNNYIITDAGSSLSINTFTLNAGWSWKINNVSYTNPSLVNINVPLASSGYTRIDLIVLNASNTAVIVLGVQSAGTAITPNVPLNTIAISSVFSDSTVHTVVIPKPRYPVSQYLRDGITDYSPSENTVYDALVLKKSISTGNNYKWETTGATGSLQETTVTANRAVSTDANGLPVASATTATELGYVNGVTGGIQAQLNTKLSSFGSVSTNYIPKSTGVNTLGNSIIRENSQYLGINTVNIPAKDITLGNQSDKEIGIEEDFAVVPGKSLTLKAGRSNDFMTSPILSSLSTGLSFVSIAFTPNGDLYGITNSKQLYRRAYSTTTFTLVRSNMPWASAPSINSYLYTSKTGVLYYIIPWWDSTGSVYTLNTSDYSTSIYSTEASTTDYLIASNGYTYRTYDSGGFPNNFVQRKLTSGGEYATVISGLPFLKLCEAPNGNIYAIVQNGDVYVQYSGVGAFIALNQTYRNWNSLSEDYNNNIYISESSDVYFLDNSSKGTSNLDGGSLKNKAGTGKGTGSSNFEVYTGQKTASGTDMQVETLRLRIDNEGHITSTTMPVYADNTAALAGGLTTGKFYRTSTGTLMIVY